jgi:predicted HAD superfamily Cof-like phosphohydrolase
MKDPKSLASVAEFHQLFKHPILRKPSIPSKERVRLRVSLLAEELKELEQALAAEDVVEVADALCDLQYVLSGAILEFGLADQFKALFEEVQRSNMSKACQSEEEAKVTVEHYERQGVQCFYKEDGGKFLVYRKSDMKTLKSIKYSPADLRSIIENS